jgi:hypothetical protein
MASVDPVCWTCWTNTQIYRKGKAPRCRWCTGEFRLASEDDSRQTRYLRAYHSRRRAEGAPTPTPSKGSRRWANL